MIAIQHYVPSGVLPGIPPRGTPAMLLVWGYIRSHTEILLQNWGRRLVPGEAYFGDAIWFLGRFLFHVKHLGGIAPRSLR